MRCLRVKSGFSLIELIIVVVIIGVIGAIAVPRMSRGAEGAVESALRKDLAVMRKAVDLYHQEHGGAFPTNYTTFADQLTLYTDFEGNTSPSKTAEFRFGPYLRAVPALPVGANAGSNLMKGGGETGDPSAGWIYRKGRGIVKANTSDDEVDSRGKRYASY